MLDDLRREDSTCDGTDCERTLPDDPALVFQSAGGERRAYACPCGAVTITVVRDRPAE